MTGHWEPGTQYNYGDVVIYESVEYKIIQPHRSQGDWTPDNTPALWGRMQGGGGHHGHHHEHKCSGPDCGCGAQQYQQQQQQQQPQYNYGSNVSNPGPPTPTVQATQEEKRTGWSSLSDERKHQLEVGGGLLAGAAVLGGAFAAYGHHKKSGEQQKGEAWAMSNWLEEAKQRTNQFNQSGPQGPYTWVLTQGKNIPSGAIQCGQEKNGNALYVCRAYYNGGIHVGKCGRHLGKGAVIGYDGKEIEIDTYEILLGDSSRLKWVSAGSPNRPIEGGREQDGTELIVAQAYHEGSTQVGKYSTQLKGACIAYGGKEVIVDRFQILTLA